MLQFVNLYSIIIFTVNYEIIFNNLYISDFYIKFTNQCFY